jgi:hypothetical protein
MHTHDHCGTDHHDDHHHHDQEEDLNEAWQKALEEKEHLAQEYG